MTRLPSDAGVRERALDPQTSFLVQAPAGSGKTELLIQRYLRLLAIVDQPEAILAVTFTVKAAAELKKRVIEALRRASEGRAPGEAHLRRGVELAQAALENDQRGNWRLLDQPGRLRIGTLDAVNAWVAGSSPLICGDTGELSVTDDAEPLYQEAARQTVALAAEDDDHGRAVRVLLSHCDNQADRLVRLLSRELGRRDQWLRHLGSGLDANAVRPALENTLAMLIERALERLKARLDDALQTELLALLRHASEHLPDSGPADLAAWRELSAFPPPQAAQVHLWRGLPALLLTQQGAWRKPRGVTKTIGFPTTHRPRKDQLVALLARLQEDAGLLAELQAVARLPHAEYGDAQWRALAALSTVMPVSAAVLQTVMRAAGTTDFTEVGAEALATLGAHAEPGELALVLDHRLQHVLVDEYQDTSRTQLDLLRALTAGWSQGDGRSLFLVGDPMQSIYRFREADVGVYLNTIDSGLGEVPLEFLQLQENFRSAAPLVEWVNRVFAEILPDVPDVSLGGVPFSPSQAFVADGSGAGVVWSLRDTAGNALEAEQVAEIVGARLDRQPEASIGILVRSRAHADGLGAALRDKGIRYAAPDLEHLESQSCVQDLLALTRALVHLGDRGAWLAVLRAPWCGLSLADLHALAAPDHDTAIWDLLQASAVRACLSPAGRARVEALLPQLAAALNRRGACGLRELVEGTWRRLGGDRLPYARENIDAIEGYLSYLEKIEVAGDCDDMPGLVYELGQQYRTAEGVVAGVQLMTMHKAKGLEFDVVILPGLDRRTRTDERPLLVWDEFSSDDDVPQLTLAPLNARAEDHDPLYEWLWQQEKRRVGLERDRLLYVAATRARHALYLLGAVEVADEELVAPDASSLLGALWQPCLSEIEAAGLDGGQCGNQPVNLSGAGDFAPDWVAPALRRVPADAWFAAQAAPPCWATAEDREVEFDWAGRWAPQAGSVVHRWLQHITESGSAAFTPAVIEASRPAFARMLTALGTGAADLDRAVDRVTEALVACLADERGRWLLSSAHPDSRCEVPVTVAMADGMERYRIDRYLVTDAGEAWLVDYKTSVHDGAGLEAFLASEAERYREQLGNYRRAMATLTEHPVRTALYFPLLQVFQEVELG